MALSYVRIFADTSGAVDMLSDAEAGRLFKAVLHWIAGETQELPGQEKFVFAMLKAQFERDAASYDSYVEKQRENGKKGGRPKKANGLEKNPENPSLFSETQKTQYIYKDEYIYKDKYKDKYKESECKSAPRFTRPTIDDVKAYADEQKYPNFDAQRFMDYYESKGWLVGKSPMKDWKAAVRNWARNDAGGFSSAKPAHNYAQHTYTDADYEDAYLDLSGGGG